MTLRPGFGFLKEGRMPWQEVITMELRQQLVHDALRRVVPATELLSERLWARRSLTNR